MAILSGFSDLVEPVSIDEAFIDVTGSACLFGSGVEIAKKVKHEI
jgi:DNA polymerase-4